MVQKTSKKFKILLLNFGYGTGLNGSVQNYIFSGNRYIHTSKKTQQNVLNRLNTLISEEKPDLICLIEIKKGQITTLLNDTYKYYDIETKYSPKSPLRNVGLFNQNSNAFISNKDVLFKKHYMKHGSKKLVYEINITDNLSIFMAHFSLKKNTRKKQFMEINNLIDTKKQTIVCGDFNIFNGVSEIKYLLSESNLKCAHNKPTFPAYKPKKSLDLFLCSKQLNINSRVLANQISDHLPVILEVKL